MHYLTETVGSHQHSPDTERRDHVTHISDHNLVEIGSVAMDPMTRATTVATIQAITGFTS